MGALWDGHLGRNGASQLPRRLLGFCCPGSACWCGSEATWLLSVGWETNLSFAWQLPRGGYSFRFPRPKHRGLPCCTEAEQQAVKLGQFLPPHPLCWHWCLHAGTCPRLQHPHRLRWTWDAQNIPLQALRVCCHAALRLCAANVSGHT